MEEVGHPGTFYPYFYEYCVTYFATYCFSPTI